MDEHADNVDSDQYDTQPGDSGVVAMGNIFPRPTQTYPHQPQGQQAAPVSQHPGLNTFANQPTVQAPPVIHPIYQQPPAPASPPAAPPVAQPPVAPLPIAPQPTAPTTGQTTIVSPHPQPRRQNAAVISIILGVISLVMGALPVCGIVAVLPGALGVVTGLRGMRTRQRNLALFGILLSVGGIALAATLVA
jgi:hypothetical protein